MDVDDKRRYFVVGSVFMEIVTPLFRQRLENNYKSCGFGSLPDFLNSKPVIHILFHLRHRNAWCCTDRLNCVNGQTLPLIYCQWNLLYSENPNARPHYCHCKYIANAIQLSDLDITLCSLILLTCCNHTGTEEQAIRLLRQFKNDYLSHNTTGQISEGEFNSLWTELTTNVLNLDPSKQDYLIRVENRPLDDGLCSKYCANLLDIHKKLDEVHISINTIQGALDTRLNTVNENVQKLLSYAERAPVICDLCKKEILHDQKMEKRKPYRLGQDIFRLHHQIDLRSVLNVDIKEGVSDGVVMDDGRLVLCLNYPGRLLICNTDGSEVDSIPLQDIPWKVTAVNNSTVAVRLADSHCIEMYDINNKHKLKSIPLPGQCWGITTINNKLVVGCIDRRILMIDAQTGEVVQTIHTDCIPVRLHTSGDRIFYCDIFYSNNYNLYCYSYTDDKVTTLTLPSIPISITSLQDGSLYVVCRNGSVQHVSSDVQHYKPVELFKGHCITSYNVKQRKLFTYNKAVISVFHEI